MEGGVDFTVNLIFFSILFIGFAINFYFGDSYKDIRSERLASESRFKRWCLDGYYSVGLLSHVQILSNVWHLVYGEECVTDCEGVDWLLDSYTVTVPLTLFIVGVLQLWQLWKLWKSEKRSKTAVIKLAVLFILELINLAVAIGLWLLGENSNILKSYDAFATLLSVQRLLVYLEREDDTYSVY